MWTNSKLTDAHRFQKTKVLCYYVYYWGKSARAKLSLAELVQQSNLDSIIPVTDVREKINRWDLLVASNSMGFNKNTSIDSERDEGEN